jgi:hypothetical protein
MMKTGINRQTMDKQRMVAVWGEDLKALLAGDGDLSLPQLSRSTGGVYYAVADELRAWREARLQHTSGEAK